MKLFLALFILAVAGFAGWYIYCPTPVIQDFQAAVNSGKADAVKPFLDMAELKKNTADFVRVRYSRTDIPNGQIPEDQVDQIVDSFLTPENIILMMKGVKVVPGTAPVGDPGDPKEHPIDCHYQSPDVESIDVYLSHVQTPDNRVSLLFEREGWFDWKLGAFRFSWD